MMMDMYISLYNGDRRCWLFDHQDNISQSSDDLGKMGSVFIRNRAHTIAIVLQYSLVQGLQAQ